MKIIKMPVAISLAAIAVGLAACGSSSSESSSSTSAAPAAPAAGGQTAVAKDGLLSISADPDGQLLYVETTATATAGPLKLEMPNASGVPHNIVIENAGIETAVITEGTVKASGEIKAGTFVYYCSVPGHREAGMVGELTVR